MKQEGLLFYTDTWLTLVGLMIFFSFFVYMIIMVYKTHTDYFDKMSKIPLEEDAE